MTALVILGIALVCALGALVYLLIQLNDANDRIEDQQRQIEEQRELIEKKETFGADARELLRTVREFEGVLTSTVVPFERYEDAIRQAWHHRWSSAAMDIDISAMQRSRETLDAVLASSVTEASTNASDSMFESVIDALGHGFISSAIDDADSYCEGDVLACVASDHPLTIHFDAADDAQPYMTDWLRTGVAYHEFAHVLQFTNPEPTEAALVSFHGDRETMADCFALTFLDGWTLDHRVWVNSYTYWDLDIGYGYECNASQQDVIRDWYSQLGFHFRPISQ